jgi:glutamyl/glutaminyl-tRNA synthetase
MLIWKDSDVKKTKTILEDLLKILCDIPENEFIKDNIKNAVWDYTEKVGKGNVLWPFRVVLTGLEKSPDPFIIAEILGKKETLKRLENAKLKMKS